MLNSRTAKAVIGVFAVVLAIPLVFVIAKAVSMNHMIGQEIDALKSNAGALSLKDFDHEDLEGLPEPVQRYFRHVLRPGQKPIAWVTYKSSGTFKLPFSEKIFKVSANEYLSAVRPELIFDARFQHCPVFGLWVRVRDKYAAQKGNMFGNLLSGFTIFDLNDEKELNQDMFLRYIGHLTLIPTALLPNAFLRWEPVDTNSAKLVVADGENSGSARVFFNDAGEIVRWESDGRYDRLDDQYRKVRHIGYRSNYQDISGIKIPLDFKVDKILPDGTHEVFWQGKITDVRFDGIEGAGQKVGQR